MLTLTLPLSLLETVEMHAKRWSETEVRKLGRCGMNGRLKTVRVWIGLIWLAAICMVVQGLGWSAERLLFLEEDFAKCLTDTIFTSLSKWKNFCPLSVCSTETLRTFGTSVTLAFGNSLGVPEDLNLSAAPLWSLKMSQLYVYCCLPGNFLVGL